MHCSYRDYFGTLLDELSELVLCALRIIMPQGLDLVVDEAIDECPKHVQRRLGVASHVLVRWDLVPRLFRALPDADDVVMDIHAQLLDPLGGGELLALLLLLLLLLLRLAGLLVVGVLVVLLVLLVVLVDVVEPLLHLLELLELLGVPPLVGVQLERQLLVHLVDVALGRLGRQPEEGERRALLQALEIGVDAVAPLLHLAHLVVCDFHVALVHVFI
mmetsp:Transcript_57793/g.163056  ORF Transcript_57793/g.163056 Transcript_57793/m.163056 type:complete len:217 (-) Transcript_57793:499-1149(-)